MYHDTCYVADITRRTPDYSQSPPSQTDVPQVSNTSSALVIDLVTNKVIEIKIKQVLHLRIKIHPNLREQRM